MESQQTICIPNTDVGILIGKGGATIKNISERSGARIQISVGISDDGKRKVILSGDQTQIDSACL
jgi:hypothetical protein